MTTTLTSFPVSRERTRSLLLRPESASLAFLIVIIVFLAAFLPNFATSDNIKSVIAQISVVGIVAVALNQVILAGEIDISSGSLLALCALVAGPVAASMGGLIMPLLTAIALGALIGTFNGVLSTFGRIPSIIVTLATLSIIRGGVLSGFGGVAFNAPIETRWLGLGDVFGIPAPILTLVLVTIAFALLNRNSSWGRNIIALGGNERAARLIGIPVNRVKLIAFIAAGAAVGLASLVYIGQVGQVQATAATGFELQAIAAVVVGGTSINGGRGSTYAPIIGAVLIGVITNAMSIAGVPGVLNSLVLGALILLAISTDVVRRRIAGVSA